MRLAIYLLAAVTVSASPLAFNSATFTANGTAVINSNSVTVIALHHQPRNVVPRQFRFSNLEQRRTSHFFFQPYEGNGGMFAFVAHNNSATFLGDGSRRFAK